MTHVSKTARYAVIYAIGVLLERGVSFIMLPIYTRYLTPADYGTLELLTMTLDVIAILAGLGLSEAVFRFYYKYKNTDERNLVISTVTILLIASYLVVSVLGFFCSPWISNLILNGVQSSILYTRIMFACLFLQSLIIVPLIFIKAEQRPFLFVLITSVKLLLQLSLNVYFVVIVKMHVLGVLYSTLLTSAIIGSFLVSYTFKIVRIRISAELSKALIRFGAPLIISSIASFILTFSDRYFLKEFSDIKEVGIYSLGYKLGFVLWMFVVRPVFNMWDPQRFEIAKTSDALETNKKMFDLFNILLISVGLVISIFSFDLFRIMSSADFWDAYKIVPIVIVAYIVQGWTVFTNFGAFFTGKTKIIAHGNMIAAGLIIVLSCVLIPAYGGFGAAVATVLAFLARFGVIYYYSQQCYKLILNWQKVVMLLFIASVTYVTSIFFHYDQISVSMLKNSILLLCYLSALIFLPILDKEEKQAIVAVFRHPTCSLKAILFNS